MTPADGAARQVVEDNQESPEPGSQDASSAASPMKPVFEVQIDNFPDKVDRLVNCISKVGVTL